MSDAAEMAYNTMMTEKDEADAQQGEGLTASEVRQIREDLGYTQASFGRMLGVTRAAVSNWEGGKGVGGAPAKLIQTILALRDLQRRITMG